MKNKYFNLIKDTLIFAIGTIGSKIILFVLVPLYTNCLTPSEYGIADLVFTLSLLLLPFVCLGINNAIIRFGLSKNENPDNVLLCGLIIALIGTLIAIIITPLIGLYESIREWKWYFCAYIVLQMYLTILQNYAKSIGKNKTYAIVSITYTLVLAVLNIIFLLFGGMGVRGYLLANVLATVVAVIVFLFVCKVFTLHKRAIFNSTLLKQMLKYSMPLMIDGTLWWLIQSSNKLFVEYFLGADILGLYTVAIKIPALMYVIVTIFSQAWGISTVKETEGANDTTFYKTVFSIYTFLTFFACAAMVSIIEPFMSIYVSEEYFISWQYIPLLLIGNAFLAISDFFGAFYNALKMPVKNMIVSAVAATVSVLISVLTMRYIGMWAAVLSTFIAYFVIMWIRLIDIRKFVKIKINWFSFLLSQFIVITHATLVTLKIQPLLVSLIALTLFFIVNFKSIRPILKRLGKIYNKFRFFVRDLTINSKYRKRIKNIDFSIISSDCVGGVICKDLRCRFNSPTINFYFSAGDYIKFISNLKQYIEYGVLRDVTQPGEYVKVAIEIENEQIIAHCIHYKTAEEFIEKWNSRKVRVNYDNCFFIMTDRNDFTEEHLRMFDALPYKNKVCFVHKEYPDYLSAFYIKGSEQNGMVKGMTEYKSIFTIKRRYDDFDFVSWLNGEQE